MLKIDFGVSPRLATADLTLRVTLAPMFPFCLIDRSEQSAETRRLFNGKGAGKVTSETVQIILRQKAEGYHSVVVRHRSLKVGERTSPSDSANYSAALTNRLDAAGVTGFWFSAQLNLDHLRQEWVESGH